MLTVISGILSTVKFWSYINLDVLKNRKKDILHKFTICQSLIEILGELRIALL